MKEGVVVAGSGAQNFPQVCRLIHLCWTSQLYRQLLIITRGTRPVSWTPCWDSSALIWWIRILKPKTLEWICNQWWKWEIENYRMTWNVQREGSNPPPPCPPEPTSERELLPPMFIDVDLFLYLLCDFLHLCLAFFVLGYSVNGSE